MVTLTLGKKWQDQIEEIANLKVEKAELEEEHTHLMKKFNSLSGELSRSQYKHQGALKELEEVRQGKVELELKASQDQETILALTKERDLLQEQLEDTRASLLGLQIQIDDLNRDTQAKTTLINSLREELTLTESLKDNLEQSKEELSTECSKKQRQLELAEKSKEHSRKHVEILVKEKNRLLSKPDASTSKSEPQVIMSQVPVTSDSWSQVEIQRLKNTIKQLQEHSQNQQQEMEKLKKENWNLVNRLRNKR